MTTTRAVPETENQSTRLNAALEICAQSILRAIEAKQEAARLKSALRFVIGVSLGLLTWIVWGLFA